MTPPPESRNPGRRWLQALLIALAAALMLAFLATSAQPWVPERRTPNAEQVEAARVAFRAARLSRTTGKPSTLALGSRDLDAIAALISQGFDPYRADARVEDGTLTLTVSRPVLFRWLNARLRTRGQSRGFPHLEVTVGSLYFPPWLSRVGLELGRQLLALRGAKVPPLDTLVQGTAIARTGVKARIFLPRTGLIDEAVSDKALALDERVVAEIYCRLAAQQRAAPDPLFVHQLQRALAAAGPEPVRNGAALIALAMLVVDPSVGELAGDTEARVAKCLLPVPATTLQGRNDSPKHWALSAALTIATGSRLAVAMGEWKELADSLSRSSFLARGDRSGFSFVDLAADRAGYLTAKALTDSARVAITRVRLARTDDAGLLPPDALALSDGMKNEEFLRRYGATDDPRFLAEVARIDAVLAAAGVR